MRFTHFLLLFVYAFGIFSGVSTSTESEPQLALEWKTEPKKLERGIKDFAFVLHNKMSKVYKTSLWIEQFGKFDYPNVVIFAQLKNSEKKPLTFNPDVSMGQLPFEAKRFEPGTEEEILASVHVSVDEGTYLVWAELMCDRNIVSNKIEIDIQGGKIVPRKLKQ